MSAVFLDSINLFALEFAHDQHHAAALAHWTELALSFDQQFLRAGFECLPATRDGAHSTGGLPRGRKARPRIGS